MFSFLISIAKDLLASSVRFAKAAAMICVAAVGIFFATPILLTVLGYKVNAGVTETAKIGAEKYNVAECDRIISYGLFGPPSGEVRRMCIRKYAEITRDPSACELLLPSDYGWSCLGAVEEKLFSGRLCTRSGALDHPVVYCNRESEGELTIDRPQIEDCSQYKRKDLREWCYDARTELLDGAHDCQKITRDVVRDFCEYNYAIKMRDPLLCSAVLNGKRRDFCSRYVSLSVKYLGSGSAVP